METEVFGFGNSGQHSSSAINSAFQVGVTWGAGIQPSGFSSAWTLTQSCLRCLKPHFQEAPTENKGILNSNNTSFSG